MNDSPDLRKILKAWPYDPEHDARIVHGDDGRDLLQVRTPLGIEQYEMDGRPDGLRPHGVESALEYHTHRLNRAKFSGSEADFELSPQECGDLFHEGTLYYFRYVRLFQLKDWTRTIRDTARNLQAFDLLHRYAQREEDQQFLEKWRHPDRWNRERKEVTGKEGGPIKIQVVYAGTEEIIDGEFEELDA